MALSLLQKEYIAWMDIYSKGEFDDSIDPTNIEHIGILYTTFEVGTEEHNLHVYANIANANDPKLVVQVDGIDAYTEALGAEGFLEDVSTWTFDGLYTWALLVIGTEEAGKYVRDIL